MGYYRSKRLWIVAYTESERHGGRSSKERELSKRLVLQGEQEGAEMGSQTEGRSESRGESELPDTDKIRRVRGSAKKQAKNEEIETLSESQSSSNDTQRSVSNATSERIQGSRATREQESQSQIEEEVFGCCHPREGADYWAFEPSVGRMADGVPDWVDRIKGLGNAIVPQIAKLIMDRIKVLL